MGIEGREGFLSLSLGVDFGISVRYYPGKRQVGKKIGLVQLI